MRPKYRQRIVKAGRTIEVEQTYPTRFGDNLTREHHRPESVTPLAQEKYNEELAIRKLTRIINENFAPDDWWVTLHYEKGKRPESEEAAKKQLSKFMAELRKIYSAEGVTLKALKTTAVGERGAIHHHIILPRGPDIRKITAAWKKVCKASHKARPPSYVALYSDGEYSALAAYIVRQPHEDGENKKYIRRWSGTRNLRKPEETVEDIPKIMWKEPPIPKAGYYIETDSIRQGCNPVTGRPYCFYRMVKIPPDFDCYDASGRRLYGKEAAKYFREQNKKWIKDNLRSFSPEGKIIFKNEVRKNE